MTIIPKGTEIWPFPPLQGHEGDWNDYTIYDHPPLSIFTSPKTSNEKEVIELNDQINIEPIKEEQLKGELEIIQID